MIDSFVLSDCENNRSWCRKEDVDGEPTKIMKSRFVKSKILYTTCRIRSFLNFKFSRRWSIYNCRKAIRIDYFSTSVFNNEDFNTVKGTLKYLNIISKNVYLPIFV